MSPPDGPVQPIGPMSPLTARSISIKSVESDIRKNAERNLRKHLGLSGQLPADVKEAVESASKAAASKAVELSVIKQIQEAADDVSRGSILDRFDDKIGTAVEGITHIGQSTKVDKVLRERAQLLAKKKAALVAAGFSDGEAMEILLADIAARSH